MEILKLNYVVVFMLMTVSVRAVLTKIGTGDNGRTHLVFFPMVWEGILEAGERVLLNNVTSNSTCDQQLAIYADGVVKRATWAVTSTFIYYYFFLCM